LIYSDYIPAGELFLVQKVGKRFEKKNRKKIIEIDEPKLLESSAIISPDRNTLIYSSNRPGGFGGLDLWMLRKLPDGTWSIPQNLGPNVNTSGDEDYASFNPEGTKVFFSSNGLPGMGGFDVFEINWDPETNTWDSARNLGYPINTPDNERSISFSNDMKHAYMAADREGGMGDLDIYRLTFEEIEVTPALFLIKLIGNDADNPFLQADAFTVFKDAGDVVGDYAPNPESFEYTVILSPGTYSIEGEVAGQGFTEPLKVNEFMSRMGPVIKIINIGAQP
jgi:Tol biopolymer transport system component